MGAGAKPQSEYRSLLFNKETSPIYRETVHLTMNAQLYEKCHLYFSFSVGSDGCKNRKALLDVFFF